MELCRGGQGLQAALDGHEVGLPGGEALVQLLPLLLAKGAMRAVAARTGKCVNVMKESPGTAKMMSTVTQMADEDPYLTTTFLWVWSILQYTILVRTAGNGGDGGRWGDGGVGGGKHEESHRVTPQPES